MLALRDLQHVAVNSDPSASFLKKASYALRRQPDVALILDRLSNQVKRQSIESELAAAFRADTFEGTTHRVEHHLAHLASCFLVSPFREATAVSVDGFGDFASAAWGVGSGDKISLEGRVYFPHSLGVFYQGLTQYLGFPYYGNEYKVMGLAPYGKPGFLPQLRRIVRLLDDGSFALDTDYFRHHKEKISYEWSGGEPHVGTLYSPALEELLGPARGKDEPLTDRHRDIARSVQGMYEEAFFHLLNTLHARHRLDSITVAGGCGMNSVANGKIRRQTPYKRVYVQSAAGDAGGAIGAALHVWHELSNGKTTSTCNSSRTLEGDPVNGRFVMDHAYFGPSFSNGEISALIEQRANEIAQQECSAQRINDETELCQTDC